MAHFKLATIYMEENLLENIVKVKKWVIFGFIFWRKREMILLKYIILYQLQPDGHPPKYLLNQSPNYTNTLWPATSDYD